MKGHIMAKDRRSLTEGLHPEPEIDPKVAEAFVFQNKAKPSRVEPVQQARLASDAIKPAAASALIPLTARIPADLFMTLKRASFERQLQGVEPSSFQDIVVEALTPWLRQQGYLP
jgi:hypothetical protein